MIKSKPTRIVLLSKDLRASHKIIENHLKNIIWNNNFADSVRIFMNLNIGDVNTLKIIMKE